MKSQTDDIIDRMSKEGKVKTLSRDEASAIDRKLGEGLRQIKAKAEFLQKASRHAVAEMERKLPLSRTVFNEQARKAPRAFEKLGRFIKRIFKR